MHGVCLAYAHKPTENAIPGLSAIKSAELSSGFRSGTDGIPVKGSVSVAADLGRLVGFFSQTNGRVDAVVNGSGHPETGALLSIGDERWLEIFEIYFLSVVRMNALLVPLKSRQAGGSLVTHRSSLWDNR